MSSSRFWLDLGGFGSFLAGFGWVRMVSGGFMFYQLITFAWPCMVRMGSLPFGQFRASIVFLIMTSRSDFDRKEP